MIAETMVVRADSNDPFRNLAIEEHLLDHVKSSRCSLYLWRNSNTVVVGKHQNAWKECRTDLLEKEGIRLARRLSGGGAVFHDQGNLNFTILLPREDYDLQRQHKVIVDAVKTLGIDAAVSGRNDLTVNGAKFSGNAFCLRHASAYHHGTILISADMAKMSRYLQPSREKLISKGIESVRSRVVNLQEISAAITVEDMGEALIRAFAAEYGFPHCIIDSGGLDQEALQELYGKYESWDWRYGKAPRFTVSLETRFPWGGVELGLSMENGMVENVAIYSDALDVAFIEMLTAVLKTTKFQSRAVVARIRGLVLDGMQKQMAEDLAGWLETEKF